MGTGIGKDLREARFVDTRLAVVVATDGKVCPVVAADGEVCPVVATDGEVCPCFLSAELGAENEPEA